MHRLHRISWLAFAAALLGCLWSLPAQTTVPFDFAVEQDGSFTPVSAASTLTLQAPAAGQSVSLRLRIRNIRTTQVTLSSISLIGSRFNLELPPLPTVLDSGASVAIGVSYSAANSTRAAGEIQVAYLDAPGAARQTISLSVAGVAPEFRTSYTVGVDGNAMPISNGGIVAFGEAPVNSSTTAVVSVINVGSGPGTITGVSRTGAAFQTVGLPVFPVALAANGEFRFGVRFTPPQSGPFAGTLVLNLPGGDVRATLEGRGVASSFAYELEFSSGAVAIRPGEPVVLPPTPIGTTLTVPVRVTNAGNGLGAIPTITVVGSAFTLSEVPPLPVSISPNGSVLFLLNATPRDAARTTGRLRIGNDSFDLEVIGSGPLLRYSYILAGVSVPADPLTTIRFPATAVGERSLIQFVIRNSGNLEAVVPNLTVTSATGAFAIVNPPPLPARIAPGDSITVGVAFSPTTLATETASLAVGADTFPLSGAGTPPPELPPYTISGVSGTVRELEQPSIGLVLAAPYPLLLRGQMRLIFEPSNFGDDSSVQFATGGREIDFTIAAGTTDAIFSNGSNRIRFQTGSAAGNIVLAPSFSVGTVSLAAPTVLRVTLPPSVPRLLTLQVAALTASSVTFLITGSTTTRSLESIEFNFQPAPNAPAPLTQSTVNANVRGLVDNYFRSGASAGLGGVFQATVPFNLSIGSGTLPNLAQIVSGVTVTLVNSVGRSNTLSIPLL